MQNSVLSGLYLELLRALPNRWLAIVVAAVIVAGVAMYVMALPDRYESRSRVFINSDVVLRPILTGITAETDPDSREDLLKVLQATMLNSQNIESLLAVPELGFDLSTPGKRAKAAAMVRTGVTVTEQEEYENLFDLVYTDTDPVRARNVLDGLLTVLVQSKMGLAKRDYDEARKFLEVQIADYQAKLQDLETQISEFRLQNAGILGNTTYQQRLDVALAALRDAQIARQIAVANRDRVKAQIAEASKPGGDPQAAVFATDQTFPAAIDRLAALQTQLAQLLLVYTDQHPDVIATKREIKLLTEQYGLGENIGLAVAQPLMPGQASPAAAVKAAAGEAAPGQPAATSPVAVVPPASIMPAAASSGEPSNMRMTLIRANFAVMDAERRVRDATSAVRTIQTEAGVAPAAEAQLDQLTRTHAVVKENYELLLRRRESAKIGGDADVSSGVEQFRIIEAPTTPSSPASPDRPTYLMLGALIALASGGALAYGLGLVRGAFVSAAEAEQALGLPVIATLTDQRGLVSRVSGAVDTMMWLGAALGIFAAAYVLSATGGWIAPIREGIIRFFEANIAGLVGLVQ